MWVLLKIRLMDLKGILSVSGYSDLFKLVKQAKNSIIVESMKDQTRMPAYATHKIIALEDIAIFTDTEDVPLADIFRSIYKKTDGTQAISHKASGKELKSYFEEILPDYDKDRVYVSDIKRVFNWFNQLQALGIIDLEIPEEEKVEDEAEAEAEKSEETEQ